MNFKITCGFNDGCNTEINGWAIYTITTVISNCKCPEKGNSEFRNDNNDKFGASQQPWPRKLFRGRRLRLHEPIFTSSLLGWPCWQTNQPIMIYWTWHAMNIYKHGTHFISLSLSLSFCFFLLLSCSAVKTSFDHLSYNSHIYLQTMRERNFLCVYMGAEFLQSGSLMRILFYDFLGETKTVQWFML